LVPRGRLKVVQDFVVQPLRENDHDEKSPARTAELNPDAVSWALT
jgi:hypothetical protein